MKFNLHLLLLFLFVCVLLCHRCVWYAYVYSHVIVHVTFVYSRHVFIDEHQIVYHQTVHYISLNCSLYIIKLFSESHKTKLLFLLQPCLLLPAIPWLS